MDFIPKYNNDILEIWNKSQAIIRDESWGKLVPLFYDEEMFPIGKKVLFIGGNPSFVDEKDKKRYAEKCDLYTLLNFSIDFPIFKTVLQDQITALREHSYFEPIQTLFDDIKDFKWAHIDALAMRSTRQDLIKDFFKCPEKRSEREPFLDAQVSLAISMIIELRPDIIVFINAHARDLIIHSKGQEIKRDRNRYYARECYCDFVSIGDSHIPALFTRPFSKSAARMEIGSKRLFEWNLKRVCENFSRIQEYIGNGFNY